jgi:hypothetical protein
VGSDVVRDPKSSQRKKARIKRVFSLSAVAIFRKESAIASLASAIFSAASV